MIIDGSFRFESIPLLILIIIFLSLLSSHSNVYAQQRQTPSQQTMDIVIISPTSGQHVPIGGGFIITGKSTANTGSGCRVYIGWNGLKPYQLADAMGPNGDNDYSMWIFMFNSNYHTLAAGKNILTAELSCPVNNTVLTKNYDVIVWGMDSNTADNNQAHGGGGHGKSNGGSGDNGATPGPILPAEAILPYVF
jgi:hypothetical protein